MRWIGVLATMVLGAVTTSGAEEARAKLLNRLVAATNEHGLLLVFDNLQAWGTTLEVTNKDANLLTLGGVGIDDSTLPPKELTFSARIHANGNLVLDLSNRSGDLTFDVFLDTGMFSMRQGGFALVPLDAAMREGIAKRRQEVARILKQHVPEPTVVVYDSNKPGEFAKVKKMKMSFPAAEVNCRGSRGRENGSLQWVDGRLDTKWGGPLSGNAGIGTYSIRYKERPKTMAIGIMAVAGGQMTPGDRAGPLESVSLTINGQLRVPLPSLPGDIGLSTRPALVEVRFSDFVDLIELRFHVLAGFLPLYEIVMLE